MNDHSTANPYTVGQLLQWTPMHWRWDVARLVSVVRLYRRGFALLSNGVLVDRDGVALVYAGRPVGRVDAAGSK